MNPIHVFRALSNFLKPHPNIYTTIIYPVRGQAVVIRDDLNIRYERPWYQVGESLRAELYSNDHDLSDLEDANHWASIDSSTLKGVFYSALLADADTANFDYLMINPASSLPIVNGRVDVIGSPIGIDLYSDCWSVFSSFVSDF